MSATRKKYYSKIVPNEKILKWKSATRKVYYTKMCNLKRVQYEKVQYEMSAT